MAFHSLESNRYFLVYSYGSDRVVSPGDKTVVTTESTYGPVLVWFGLVQYASVRFGSGRFDYLLPFLYGSVQLRTTALISPRIGSVPDLGNSVLLHTIGQFFEKREEKNAVPPAVGRQKISVRTSKKKVAFCT